MHQRMMSTTSQQLLDPLWPTQPASSALCAASTQRESTISAMFAGVCGRASVQLLNSPDALRSCKQPWGREVQVVCCSRLFRHLGAGRLSEAVSRSFRLLAYVADIFCLLLLWLCAGTRVPAVAPSTAAGAATQCTRRRAASSSWRERSGPSLKDSLFTPPPSQHRQSRPDASFAQLRVQHSQCAPGRHPSAVAHCHVATVLAAWSCSTMSHMATNLHHSGASSRAAAVLLTQQHQHVHG